MLVGVGPLSAMDYGMCLLLIEGEEKVAAFIKRGLVGGRSRSVYNAQNGAMLFASTVVDFFHPLTEKGSSQQ